LRGSRLSAFLAAAERVEDFFVAFFVVDFFDAAF
jgi:hypothetical protein